MHRKGATRAFGPGREEVPKKYRAIGQPVMIPGTMGTASYILHGTDNAMDETFGSTAHGAGRKMSRAGAKREFNGNEVKKMLRIKRNHYKSKFNASCGRRSSWSLQRCR